MFHGLCRCWNWLLCSPSSSEETLSFILFVTSAKSSASDDDDDDDDEDEPPSPIAPARENGPSSSQKKKSAQWHRTGTTLSPQEYHSFIDSALECTRPGEYALAADCRAVIYYYTMQPIGN
uniref:Uncharacterized protein n=1 Tax=Timema bartmani TaxID=61472 RepID=A0A7R9EUM7_9NEOP|nr:unnamed protein product [Timema bartmani]